MNLSTYQNIKDVLQYEAQQSETIEQALNIEDTARRVWRYLQARNLLTDIKTQPSLWRAEELTHLVVLDWLSSFEMSTN